MAIHLTSSINELPGIGPKAFSALKNKGIRSVGDLLLYFPYRYDDYSDIVSIASCKRGMACTIVGTVASLSVRPAKKNPRLKIVEAVIEDETGEIDVAWFNQQYLEKTIPSGTRVALSGVIEHRFGFTLMNPIVEKGGIGKKTGKILPVYSLPGVMKMQQLREAVWSALGAVKEFEDWLPREILDNDELLGFTQALEEIHRPVLIERATLAVQRLKFNELFLHQTMFFHIRNEREKSLGYPIDPQIETLKTFGNNLKFSLTKAQKRSVWEMVKDMESGSPMNRLLQGDVGSGKTVVSGMLADHLLHSSSGPVAYLAPTDILAQQQYETFREFLADYSVGLLTRTTVLFNGTKIKKSELKKKLADGEIDCVIGTHALLQQGVEFPNLQLAIIDEQHRFGVKQRHAMLDQGERPPHLLTMTATPIPRTLAHSLYGDLDISILDEMPSGRKPIETKIVPPAEREGLWGHVRDQVSEGKQIYVVCPLINPSDSHGAQSVKEVEKLLKSKLKGLSIESLHGRLKADDKRERMNRFSSGKIDILISTTVIEVGVDVPNATVMIIFGAERFGLAQLHQLRGRVGRSDVQSYCLLLPDDLTEHSRRRLEAMENSTNGFELADIDLQLRGPGNLFGDAQSGFPDFKLATAADVDLMKKARDWASQLFSERTLDDFPLLKDKVFATFDEVHLE